MVRKSALKDPSNVDPVTKIPHGHTRIGACGHCGGHVTSATGYGQGVPPDPKCIDCGATMDTKHGLPMKAGKGDKNAKAKKAIRGWFGKKDKDADGM